MWRRNGGRHRFTGQADAYRPAAGRPTSRGDDADRFLAELRSTVDHPIGMPAPTEPDQPPAVPPVPDGVDAVCLSPAGPRTDPSLTRGVESGIDSDANIGRI